MPLPARKRPATPRPAPLLLAVALLTAAGLKATLLALGAFPFNSDEAIVGLMAKHILEGARPIFFYGQAYLGSTDAWLVAGAFSLVGPHVVAIRMVQVLLYLGTVVTTVALAWRLTRSQLATAAAGLLIALPTVNVTLYTTVSLGGYGEALLLGNLLLLIALRIDARPEARWDYGVWGALAGFGFWTFGLTLVYSLPAAIWIAGRSIRHLDRRGAAGRLLAAAVCAAAGALPWLAFVVAHGSEPALRELLGSAIAGASGPNLIRAVGAHMLNLLLFGTTVVWGLRPPWEVRWLAPALIPIACGFWLAALGASLRSLREADARRRGRALLLAVCGTLVVLFVMTPFGADPSGRYFLPLAAPMAVLGGWTLARLSARAGPGWAYAVLAGVLSFNLFGTVAAARRNPPGLTTQFAAITQIDHGYDQQLIEFLLERGETRGYTNYWVAYPLAFLSDERLIYVPTLPYHADERYTPRDNRYAPYNAQVAASARVAYITTNLPDLKGVLRAALEAERVEFQETDIGPYHVFYGLSRAIGPHELALPWSSGTP